MTLPSYRHGFPNDRPRATILLVEDEPFVREATCSILQNAGFEVLPAEDGHDASRTKGSSSTRRMVARGRSFGNPCR